MSSSKMIRRPTSELNRRQTDPPRPTTAFKVPDVPPHITRIVVFSDTHSRIPSPDTIPYGHIALHCGDFVENPCKGLDPSKPTPQYKHRKSPQEQWDMIKWYMRLPFRYRVAVAGNHDIALDRRLITEQSKLNTPELKFAPYDFNGSSEHKLRQLKAHRAQGFFYLDNESCQIPIHGENDKIIKHLSVFGSPGSMKRGRTPAKTYDATTNPWAKISGQYDIVLTHGPAFHTPKKIGEPYLDRCALDSAPGDPNLTEAILKRLQPKLHAHGHIHIQGYDTFVTASGRQGIVCNAAMSVSNPRPPGNPPKCAYQATLRPPLTFDWNHKTDELVFVPHAEAMRGRKSASFGNMDKGAGKAFRK